MPSTFAEADTVLQDRIRANPVYLGLLLSLPNRDGTTNEVSAGGYARQIITFGATDGSGVIINDAFAEFGPATASWGKATHLGLFDAVSAGNFIMFGTLSPQFQIQSGDRVRFQVGDLIIGQE